MFLEGCILTPILSHKCTRSSLLLLLLFLLCLSLFFSLSLSLFFFFFFSTCASTKAVRAFEYYHVVSIRFSLVIGYRHLFAHLDASSRNVIPHRHNKSSREARPERVGSICLHCSSKTRVSDQGPVASDYVWVLANSRKV